MEEIMLQKNPKTQIKVGDILRVVSVRGTYVYFAEVETVEDEKAVAWLHESSGTVSKHKGGGYDIPLFRR